MKKKIAMMLLTVMTLSLAACGGQKDTNASNSSSSSSVEESSTPSSTESSAAPSESSSASNENTENAGNETAEIASALDILTTVWGNYDEADKFPVGGGDSANLNFEGPGAFDAANADELNVTLGFPTDHVDKIDDAASMMNAMMANNFTAGVYHVTDGANVQTVADGLKETIMAKQWMCGMPEKMIVVAVDDYVISAFGLSAAIDPFKTEIAETYANATLLYEKIITE